MGLFYHGRAEKGKLKLCCAEGKESFLTVVSPWHSGNDLPGLDEFIEFRFELTGQQFF